MWDLDRRTRCATRSPGRRSQRAFHVKRGLYGIGISLRATRSAGGALRWSSRRRSRRIETLGVRDLGTRTACATRSAGGALRWSSRRRSRRIETLGVRISVRALHALLDHRRGAFRRSSRWRSRRIETWRIRRGSRYAHSRALLDRPEGVPKGAVHVKRARDGGLDLGTRCALLDRRRGAFRCRVGGGAAVSRPGGFGGDLDARTRVRYSIGRKGGGRVKSGVRVTVE